RCNIHAETTLHCLRDCDFVQTIWKSIGCSEQIFIQGDDSYEWLWYGLRWRARNALCLDSELVPQFSLKMRIMYYAPLLKNCRFNEQETTLPKLVRWNALGGTSMILNVDGSSIGNPRIFGFRGLIRNANGAWVHGFFGNPGVKNILHAELMEI
ncbi:hypothetical protein L195_g037889, partial [Trifolium pratense]